MPRLTRALGTGAAAAQAGSEIAANAGRWVKLTPDSAAKVKTLGLMPSKTPGVSHAMIGKPGNVKSWLQISTGPGSLASNPALLSGAAGIMTQLAMQQAMDDITDYLATIDAKLDDVLRAQKDAVVASSARGRFRTRRRRQAARRRGTRPCQIDEGQALHWDS